MSDEVEDDGETIEEWAEVAEQQYEILEQVRRVLSGGFSLPGKEVPHSRLPDLLRALKADHDEEGRRTARLSRELETLNQELDRLHAENFRLQGHLTHLTQNPEVVVDQALPAPPGSDGDVEIPAPVELIGMAEFISKAGISRTTAYRLINQGDLEHLRVGKRIFLPANAIERRLARARAWKEGQ